MSANPKFQSRFASADAELVQTIASANRNPGLCTVILVDNIKINGSMHRIDGEKEVMTIRRSPSGERVDLKYVDVGMVSFSHYYTREDAPRLSASYGGQMVVATHPVPFQIDFKNGAKFSGNLTMWARKQKGLHLFEDIGEGKLRRLFIPLCSVVSHDIKFNSPALDESRTSSREGGQDVNHSVLEFENREKLQTPDQRKLEAQRAYIKKYGAVSSESLRQKMASPGSIVTSRMGEMMISEGLISPAELNIALSKQKEEGKRLGEMLIDLGMATPSVVLLSIARKLQIPFVQLKEFDFDANVLVTLPYDVVKKYKVIPLIFYHDSIVIAMANPTDNDVGKVLRFSTGKPIDFVMASEEEIEWAIEYCYREHEDEMLADSLDLKKSDDANSLEAGASDDPDQAPIIKLVSQIISDGIRSSASDIHFWPGKDNVDCLFRIDGALVNIRKFSKRLLPAIVSRIKIIGRMDIAERRLPQDGRAQVTYEKKHVDLRFSVIPTVQGESVVIRILNKDAGLRSVHELGFSAKHEEVFRDIINKSFGMFLVTGPTGSGKSTTLYSALNEVKEKNVNIITVEDPVEYKVEGTNQIQVNTAPGYDFARALKNILRHDPDVIMIGEIRDYQTAQIAVESALTGHLVLSTLHTNDAAGAITRLAEMGVEPYLINSTVLGVLAQRLIKLNCPHCLAEEEVNPAIRRSLGVPQDEVFYKGKGCEHCNDTGYKGRKAVYELMELNSSIRKQVLAGGSNDDIYFAACEAGMIGLTDNALEQARAKVTSLEEVYRVRLDRDRKSGPDDS